MARWQIIAESQRQENKTNCKELSVMFFVKAVGLSPSNNNTGASHGMLGKKETRFKNCLRKL